MGFPVSTRLMRLGIGACLALLIQALLCANHSVQAGCSHYAHSRIQQLSELSRLDPQILSGLLNPDSAALPDPSDSEPTRPDRRFPCSGPSCSGHVPLPAVPGGLAVADRLDQWGNLSSLFGFSPLTPRVHHAADRTPRPIILADSIFHPPRSVDLLAG
ncbi:MAG: hypothetical protein ABS79_00065 [Planctomycetes bacterium SCN 63-9]|nr:MAG: hypothetical protein ABS79_00065 [Planctomycetes bacterium SCN 63-9]